MSAKIGKKTSFSHKLSLIYHDLPYAELTHRRPSDVTRWLGGGHNFTCKTIAMIQLALGEKIVEVVK